MASLIRYLTLILLSLLGGFYLGAHSISPLPNQLPSAIRQTGDYHYTNPLLECEVGVNLADNSPLTSLKQTLSKEIDSLTNHPGVDSVSVYFRDLNNGPWFGIQEDANFTPASLLKTPVLMTYLKESEQDPTLLSSLIITEDGREYSVQELLDQMIIFSDNTALDLLATHINYELIRALHQDLDLPLPDDSTPEDFISVKQYAGLFRLLFNASYLSRELSETALTMLSQTSFRDGLVAGVDDTIEVAHKYGVREGENGAPHQLHDCGIVYYPGHPYLLCLMTKGENIESLTNALSSLSHLVFTEIKSQHPN